MWIDLVNRRRGDRAAIHRPAFAGTRAFRITAFAAGASRHVNDHGFTLVELLIAVIVLATGLLGMASLQLAVLKSNDSARLRTIATHASYDLVDRIRANPSALPFSLTSRTDLVLPSDCTSSTCNPGDSALTCLKNDFCNRGLPSSTLFTNCASTSGCGTGNCVIVVTWDDLRGDVNRTAAHSPSFRTCARLPAL